MSLQETNKTNKFILEERGFDVLRNRFFVKQNSIADKEYQESRNSGCCLAVFDCFDDYFYFVNGDIYRNSCYYGYEFAKDEIDRFHIDVNRLNMTALICDRIKEEISQESCEDIEKYKKAESRKKLVKKWISIFNNCNNYEEFYEQYRIFNKSSLKSIDFGIFYYFMIECNKEKAFEIIMRYLNQEDSFSRFEKVMCLYYDFQRVKQHFCPAWKIYSEYSIRKHVRELTKTVNLILENKLYYAREVYFDTTINFFVIKDIIVDDKKKYLFDYLKYYESIDELRKFLNNDLSGCDLSKAKISSDDIIDCKIDDETRLPANLLSDIKYTVDKKYNRINDCFEVVQKWFDNKDRIVSERNFRFDYFFDFAYFLNYDLSDADLLFCKAINNIKDTTNINWKNAKLPGEFLCRIDAKNKIVNINDYGTFSLIQKNEQSTSVIIRKEELDSEKDKNKDKIYYISDLHLVHKIIKLKLNTESDIKVYLQKISDKLLAPVRQDSIVLIGGDTSSDINIFRYFAEAMKNTINELALKIKVVFVLGNHELWDFTLSLGKTIEKYREIIEKNDMILLQNDLLFKEQNKYQLISYDELKNISPKDLSMKLFKASLIILGGVGFSGYNFEFNANDGIYRKSLNRQEEMERTKEFENLYNKIKKISIERNVIVLTHMPYTDWLSDKNLIAKFIYIHGHSHKNYFYDDGLLKVYADNQMGYNKNISQLKYFYTDSRYNIFDDYEDGIFEISKENYIEFNKGKNIAVTFNRNYDKIFMLKKNKYYCFIVQSKRGAWGILNGGSVKRILRKNRNLQYYFDNMDSVIMKIEKSIKPYKDFQLQLSKQIKSIGGSGLIHGCIIDIDYANHVYVNPLDFQITPYWAANMIYKRVYADIESLLENQCEQLYDNYIKLLSTNSLIKFNHNSLKLQDKSELYLDTNIYEASRQIKKMQKIDNNILTVWLEKDENLLQ